MPYGTPAAWRLRSIQTATGDLMSPDVVEGPGGVTGRRGGLKHRCPSGRGGSSPSPGTDDRWLRRRCTQWYSAPEIGGVGEDRGDERQEYVVRIT